MFITNWQAPNGANTVYHRAIRYQVGPEGTVATVHSYHLEAMEMPCWEHSYTIPAVLLITNLEDVEKVLTLPGAPFEGATLVDSAMTDIAIARARAWSRVKMQRDKCAESGCDTPLGRVDTSDKSRIRIADAFQDAQTALSAGEPYTVEWVMADNTPVTHDAEAMIALRRAVSAHIKACWDHATELRTQIDAAETVEEINSIDTGQGWNV